MKRNLCEQIQELRAQYDQEVVDHHYRCNGFQAPLATSESRSEARCQSLFDTCEHLGGYQRASVSLHLRWELYLDSSTWKFL